MLYASNRTENTMNRSIQWGPSQVRKININFGHVIVWSGCKDLKKRTYCNHISHKDLLLYK